MSYRALGIYREPEFSPGKVEADAAILDAKPDFGATPTLYEKGGTTAPHPTPGSRGGVE